MTALHAYAPTASGAQQSPESATQIPEATYSAIMLYIHTSWDSPHVSAIREPSMLTCACWQNYVRWLINFKQSVVGNLHHFDNIESALSRGENVVMIANHQTEADPGGVKLPFDICMNVS